jgi:hypothetical protein
MLFMIGITWNKNLNVRSCLVITHIASESTEIYLIIVAMLMVSMAQPLLFSSQLFFFAQHQSITPHLSTTGLITNYFLLADTTPIAS